MAEGWGPTAGNHALTTETALYTWIQLHVGAPGAAGTANPATETARKQVTLWGTASAGSIASASALTWTAIAGSQDATHFTAWTASSAGTFGFSGQITANGYTAGDTYTVPSGGLTATVPLAS